LNLESVAEPRGIACDYAIAGLAGCQQSDLEYLCNVDALSGARADEVVARDNGEVL